MSTEEKLRKKIENYRSTAPISFNELKKYLLLNGFTCKESTGSSHMVFRHELLSRPFPVPVHNKQVRGVYVREAVLRVEEVRMKKER